MKSLVSTIVLFFLVGTPLWAQDRVWSLDQCMEYAVRNGYLSQRASRNVEASRESYLARIGQHLPSLSASVGAGSNFGRGIDPETNMYQNLTSFSNNYSISASLPLFNAFALVNGTLSSKIALARAQSELQKVQDMVALEVMGSYIDVLYNQGLVELTEQRVETFRTDLRRTERMSELGTRSAADVAQFASSLASEELSLTVRRNTLRTSLLALKKKMNYQIEDTLILDPNVAMRKWQTESASSIFQAAANYLPAIDVLNKTLKIEKLGLAIARSSYYPSISASGGISTSYYKMLSNEDARGFSEQIADNTGEYVSVGMSIPIFRGLAVRTSVHRAKIAFAQAQSDYNEQMRDLRIEIEQAVMDLEAAQAEIEGATKAARAADLAHRAVEHKYEQEMVSVVELQTSANLLLMARVNLLSATLRYQIKSRQVAYFSGEALIQL